MLSQRLLQLRVLLHRFLKQTSQHGLYDDERATRAQQAKTATCSRTLTSQMLLPASFLQLSYLHRLGCGVNRMSFENSPLEQLGFPLRRQLQRVVRSG